MLSPTQLRSTIRRTRADVRRTLRSPFDTGPTPRPLVFHASHHKVGTIWFSNILRCVSQYFGLRFHWRSQTGLKPQHHVFFKLPLQNPQVGRVSAVDAFGGSA